MAQDLDNGNSPNEVSLRAELARIEQKLDHLTVVLERQVKRSEEILALLNRPKRVKVMSHRTIEGFEQFWALYPKKVGRGAAETEWSRIDWAIISSAQILSALASQSQSDKWREKQGRFIPNPSTWLHQKRWMDESTINIEALPQKPRSLVDLL